MVAKKENGGALKNMIMSVDMITCWEYDFVGGNEHVKLLILVI